MVCAAETATHRLSSSGSRLFSCCRSEYHGFKSFAEGASATPFSLALSAGGAVFVDRTGIVVVVYASEQASVEQITHAQKLE